MTDGQHGARRFDDADTDDDAIADAILATFTSSIPVIRQEELSRATDAGEPRASTPPPPPPAPSPESQGDDVVADAGTGLDAASAGVPGSDERPAPPTAWNTGYRPPSARSRSRAEATAGQGADATSAAASPGADPSLGDAPAFEAPTAEPSVADDSVTEQPVSAAPTSDFPRPDFSAPDFPAPDFPPPDFSAPDFPPPDFPPPSAPRGPSMPEDGVWDLGDPFGAPGDGGPFDLPAPEDEGEPIDLAAEGLAPWQSMPAPAPESIHDDGETWHLPGDGPISPFSPRPFPTDDRESWTSLVEPEPEAQPETNAPDADEPAFRSAPPPSADASWPPPATAASAPSASAPSASAPFGPTTGSNPVPPMPPLPPEVAAALGAAPPPDPHSDLPTASIPLFAPPAASDPDAAPEPVAASTPVAASGPEAADAPASVASTDDAAPSERAPGDGGDNRSDDRSDDREAEEVARGAHAEPRDPEPSLAPTEPPFDPSLIGTFVRPDDDPTFEALRRFEEQLNAMGPSASDSVSGDTAPTPVVPLGAHSAERDEDPDTDQDGDADRAGGIDPDAVADPHLDTPADQAPSVPYPLVEPPAPEPVRVPEELLTSARTDGPSDSADAGPVPVASDPVDERRTDAEMTGAETTGAETTDHGSDDDEFAPASAPADEIVDERPDDPVGAESTDAVSASTHTDPAPREATDDARDALSVDDDPTAFAPAALGIRDEPSVPDLTTAVPAVDPIAEFIRPSGTPSEPEPSPEPGLATDPAPASAALPVIAPLPPGTVHTTSIPIPPPTTAPVTTEIAQPVAPRVLPVERSGIGPTPLDRRAGRAARLFWLWFAANASALSIGVGAVLVATGMSLRQAIVSVLAGVAVSLLPLSVGTLAGKWSGMPTLVVSRASFGLVGNVLPALVAVLSRAVWGGVLLWLLATASARTLIGAGLGGRLERGSLELVCLGVGAVLAGLVAVIGYGLVARVQLVLTVITAVLVVGLIVLTAGRIDLDRALTRPDGAWTLVLTGAIIVFGWVGLAWAQSTADVARYQAAHSRGSSNAAWAGFGTVLPVLLLAGWGALLAASSPGFGADLVRSPVDALAGVLPSWYPVPLLLAVALGTLAGAVLAFYSGGFALQALGLPTGRPLATVVATALAAAAGIGLLAVDASTTSILRDLLPSLGVPVAAWVGLFGAEMMLRRRRFHAPSLLERGGIYPDVRLVNLIAFVVVSAIGLGFVTSATPGLGWEGYLFRALSVDPATELGASDLGVLVALVLGLAVPLVSALPVIRRQETFRV